MLPVMEPVDPSFDADETGEAPPPGRAPPAEGAGPPAEAACAPPGPVEGEAEVRVRGRGAVWSVRVSGRAGRTPPGAPLLLLEFRVDGDVTPALEALVAGRSLEDLPQEVLEAALARAVEPGSPTRRRPFFEDPADPRRS
jgi:hypothetical protein